MGACRIFSREGQTRKVDKIIRRSGGQHILKITYKRLAPATFDDTLIY